MTIANPGQPALGSPNLGRSILEPPTHVATRRHRPVFTKILVSAIALCSYIGGAAAASADPNPVDTGPNPYGIFSCACQETAAPDSPALKAEIDRGLREGHSAWLPGLPAPTQPSPARP